MHRLLSSLVVAVLLCGIASAQENSLVLDTKKAAEAFWKKVDTTTQWGQWMVNVYKPYSDRMSDVMLGAISQIDPTGLSPEELLNKVKARYEEEYKSIQNIAPPEELKAYHAKILELFAATSKSFPTNPQQAVESQAMTKKLGDEAIQELVTVLTSQGVPQDIIAEFTKTR